MQERDIAALSAFQAREHAIEGNFLRRRREVVVAFERQTCSVENGRMVRPGRAPEQHRARAGALQEIGSKPQRAGPARRLNADDAIAQRSGEFLAEQKVEGWSDMPVWVHAVGDEAGFALTSAERALAAGLNVRPLADTVRDTLAWHLSRPAEQQAKLKAGITPEREKEVLAAWRATQKKAADSPDAPADSSRF